MEYQKIANLLNVASNKTSKFRTRNWWWIKVSAKKGCIFLETIDELRLTSKERCVSLEERQQIFDELRLV